MTVTVEIRGLERIVANLTPALYMGPVTEAITAITEALAADARSHPIPVDTGALASSIIAESEGLSGQVGSTDPKAPYVLGYFDESKARTEPHWPPFGPGTPLAEWAARHGIPAYLVARSIAENGTAIIPALKDAYEHAEGPVTVALQGAADAIAAQWGGG